MKTTSRSVRLLALAGLLSLASGLQTALLAGAPEPLKPIGEAKGVQPGRVVWVHDPEVTDWKGPGNGHWWEGNHTRQDRVSAMMSQALRSLTGQASEAEAWNKLFRYQNRALGKGDVGYKPGEKIAIKVNFVGFIAGGGSVNPSTYAIEKNADWLLSAG